MEVIDNWSADSFSELLDLRIASQDHVDKIVREQSWELFDKCFEFSLERNFRPMKREILSLVKVIAGLTSYNSNII
jgi:hypothetical protein